MKEPYKLVYKIRGILMVPPYLFMLATFIGETERDALVWPMGLVIFAIGVLIRIWAQMHLHYRLRIRKRLTTTGPYAYVRNPIYIANTTMLLGLTILSELLWFLPVMFVWCAAVYSFVVRREEAHLLGKYGEPYAEYLRKVPRWVPSLKQSMRNSSVQHLARDYFWQSVVAELHCFLWLLPLIGKALFSQWN